LPVSKAEEQKTEKEKKRIILMFPRVKESKMPKSTFTLIEALMSGSKAEMSVLKAKGSYKVINKSPQITTLEFIPTGEHIPIIMNLGYRHKFKEENEFNESMPLDIEKIISSFENPDFKIEKIEVWIQGAIESGNLVKLFVSVKADAGVKVILKPK